MEKPNAKDETFIRFLLFATELLKAAFPELIRDDSEISKKATSDYSQPSSLKRQN